MEYMKFESHHILSILLKRLTLLVGLFFLVPNHAQRTQKDQVNLDKIPPRIIRACCAFGYDLKVWGVPFVSIDQVISIDDLGEHRYMGHKREGIGTIYSHKGGFIDIAHLRDQIDWTRYLFTTIVAHKGKGAVVLRLRNEAGRKTLHLNVPAQFDTDDCIQLAGKIAYDFSLWHEISTWYGASTVPLVPEKFSSFSVEDLYSNLLGIHVGMKTLRSKRPFNTAATQLIASTLDSLAVVQTAQETYDAYDAVHDKWYTNQKRVPRTNITLKRDLDVLKSTRPWIVPEVKAGNSDPIVLAVPLETAKGALLTDFYRFTIDLNRKIPIEEIFPSYESDRIDQDDFGVLLQRIANELQLMEYDKVAENK